MKKQQANGEGNTMFDKMKKNEAKLEKAKPKKPQYKTKPKKNSSKETVSIPF